jgi:phage shock protein E
MGKEVRNMKALRLLTVLLLLLLGVSALAGDLPGNGGRTVVIDVRTEAEWAAGHLQGAILIPYDRIGAEITTVVPEKTTTINLYCRTGRRSGIGLETLKHQGYTDVTNLGSVEDAAKILGRPIVK